MHVLRNFRVFKALHHSGMIRFAVGLRILASRSLLRNVPKWLCRKLIVLVVHYHHKPHGRLPLLSARPAVTLATLKRAATNFAGW